MLGDTHPFIDGLGRPSDKPIDQESGITDNPWLFSGELLLLKFCIGTLDFNDVIEMDEELDLCVVVDGLYRRHPPSFQDYYKILYNRISHDESNGITFAAVASPNLHHHLANMLNYMQENGWQYNDLAPNSNFFKALRHRPIETIKKFIAYLKDIKANPNDTNAVDLRHDGDITSLLTIRQPRDRAFYKIAAGRNTSLFEVLWLAASIILSTRGSIEDNSRGGGTLMAWFRNIALQRCYLMGLNKIILDTAMNIFNWRLVKKYGKEFPVVIIDKYFDRVANDGTRHPMIDLVKRYVDLFPIA